MTSKLFLPQVGNAPTVPAQAEPPVDVARELFRMIRDHEGQQRKGMLWHDVLAFAAQRKVEAQAREGWEGHTSPQGVGANEHVRRSGYRLPSMYDGGEANYCESLCHGGPSEPREGETFDEMMSRAQRGALTAWLTSEGHRRHVLGEIDFYAEQTFIGIAYVFVPSSAKVHYWCFLACHAEAT